MTNETLKMIANNLNCGCMVEITHEYCYGNGIDIQFANVIQCHLHKATLQLLEALERILTDDLEEQDAAIRDAIHVLASAKEGE